MRQAQTATAINPSAVRPLFHIALALNNQLKHQQALEVFVRVPKALFPSMTGPQMSWALLKLGRAEEAWANTEEFLKDYQEKSGGSLEAMQALIHVVNGRLPEVEKRLALAPDRLTHEAHYRGFRSLLKELQTTWENHKVVLGL